MQFFVSFYTPYFNCFDITDSRVILNNISEVKYHFAQFSICNVLNNVEDKQILLNNLNYTSMESLFHLKGEGLCLIGIKRAFVPKEEVISTN